MGMGSSRKWPRTAADLKFVRQLGCGGFGEVWECEQASKPQPNVQAFAVKKVPLAIIQQHGLTEQLDREITLLRSLRHPGIVQLRFEFRDACHVYLGMQLASGGCMFDLLSQSGKFTNEKSAQFFYEVCDALEYLHNLPQKVVHRDIKPENILMDTGGHAMLVDFGWSNVINSADLRMTFCGTLDYMAPEMIKGSGYNESLDMWQMGVLLYEMAIGKLPFYSESEVITCRLIVKANFRFPTDLDADAQNLIVHLCNLRPEERLTARQAKRHTFVKQYCVAAGKQEDYLLEKTECIGSGPSAMCRGFQCFARSRNSANSESKRSCVWRVRRSSFGVLEGKVTKRHSKLGGKLKAKRRAAT